MYIIYNIENYYSLLESRNFMKKLFPLLLSFAPLLSCLIGCTSEPKDIIEKEPLSSHKSNFYDTVATADGLNFNTISHCEMTSYFFDQEKEIPYVNFLEAVHAHTAIELVESHKGSKFTFTYDEGNEYIKINTKEETITFSNFVNFYNDNTNNYITDFGVSMLDYIKVDEEKTEIIEFETNEKTFSLKEYGFDLIAYNDVVYLPWQIFNALYFTNCTNIKQGYLYTGPHYIAHAANTLFLTFDIDDIELVDIYKASDLYNSNVKSEQFATFNYNFFRWVVVEFYGLKNQLVSADSLDSIFQKEYYNGITYEEAISSTNYTLSQKAISDFLDYQIGDNHTQTSFQNIQARKDTTSEYVEYPVRRSDRKDKLVLDQQEVLIHRASIYGEKFPYTTPIIKDNTAYFMFDNFMPFLGNAILQPDFVFDPEMVLDLFTALIYFFDTIEKDTNVENVVFDLTANTGGYVVLAVVILAYMMENPYLTYKNELTGSLIKEYYQVDLNLDGKFDEKDRAYASKYDYFFLTSGVTFSAANLVSSTAKESGCATLIGERSSGGSCVVAGYVLPDGSAINMSAYSLNNYYKPTPTSAYKCADDGIIPDVKLSMAKATDYNEVNKVINNP